MQRATIETSPVKQFPPRTSFATVNTGSRVGLPTQTYVSTNNYSTVRPVSNIPITGQTSIISSAQPPIAPPVQIHSQILGSRVLQPIVVRPQTSTVHPYHIYTVPPRVSTAVAPVTITTPPPVPVQSTQPTIVEEIHVYHSRPETVQTTVTTPPKEEIVPKLRETRIVEEYQKPAEQYIETGRDSRWTSYYEPKTYAPPPPVHAIEEKAFCKPWMYALLGLLALGGLITAIILGVRSSGYGSANSNNFTQTQGISQSNSTLIPTPIYNTSNTTNITIAPQPPIITDPLTAPLQMSQTNLQKIETSQVITSVAPSSQSSVVYTNPVTVPSNTIFPFTAPTTTTTTTTSSNTVTATPITATVYPTITKPVYESGTGYNYNYGVPGATGTATAGTTGASFITYSSNSSVNTSTPARHQLRKYFD